MLKLLLLRIITKFGEEGEDGSGLRSLSSPKKKPLNSKEMWGPVRVDVGVEGGTIALQC